MINNGFYAKSETFGGNGRRTPKDCYKIKLHASGFRLVYQVIDDMLIIAVVAVGKRERSNVYNLASERMR